MNVGELRKALEGLPDDMELVGEASYGQQDILCTSVCTHQYDGMHHRVEDRVEYLEKYEDFYPDYWGPLNVPTFKIVLRY